MFLDELESYEIYLESNEMYAEEFEVIKPITLNEQQVRLFEIVEHSKFGILESELYAVCEYYGNNNIAEVCDLIAESHNINPNELYVLTEDNDLHSKKKEILEKLKKSRSLKERQKHLARLKNLNKVKFFRQN